MKGKSKERIVGRNPSLREITGILLLLQRLLSQKGKKH
jgi:hypothetical protein